MLLVKPLTFMNRSGVVGGARCWLAYGARRPRTCWWCVDDVALELGASADPGAGSHGGHNGLRSLIESLGT